MASLPSCHKALPGLSVAPWTPLKAPPPLPVGRSPASEGRRRRGRVGGTQLRSNLTVPLSIHRQYTPAQRHSLPPSPLRWSLWPRARTLGPRSCVPMGFSPSLAAQRHRTQPFTATPPAPILRPAPSPPPSQCPPHPHTRRWPGRDEHLNGPQLLLQLAGRLRNCRSPRLARPSPAPQYRKFLSGMSGRAVVHVWDVATVSRAVWNRVPHILIARARTASRACRSHHE